MTPRLVVPILVLALASVVVPGARAQTAPQPQTTRPRVGIALGGGSARGLAHVGVLRWLEEHRVPIDLLAGTSMGGLVGGAYASGMSPDEIEALLAGTDWDAMFGSSNFEVANVRRKRDYRAYPSHLEFGLKRGIVAPPSLNSGQRVDLLMTRIAAPYYGLNTFDELPTPFRCVSVDLRTASFVVLDRGSLARAMRATMSLPLIFPPIVDGRRVLVDGGAMNNIPADVVRSMGADRVIAVNVGDLSDRETINASMLGLAGGTLDAMMRANTRRALDAADVVIDVPLGKYGSLDWRKFRDLIREGYDAAENLRARLLPFAVDDAAWSAWQSARAKTRRTALPAPAFVRIEGAGSSDTLLMQRKLDAYVGKPIDVAALENTIIELGGFDRYQSLTWEIVEDGGTSGLRVSAQPKTYGPPFMMIGISLENTTSNDFRFGLSGRYLMFDVLGSGSELRIDGAVGSDPSAGIALYRPIWSSPFFVEAAAGIETRRLNVITDDEITAAYKYTRQGFGVDVGANIGRTDEVRAGVVFGRIDASVSIGDPGLPELGGKESSFQARWFHDSQDSPIVPSRGLHLETTIERILDAPAPPETFPTTRRSEGVTQASGGFSLMHSLARTRAKRVFLSGGAGTSFDGNPLPTDQFALGGPLRLSAFSAGEQRGDHFLLVTGGYLHQIGRLPDFFGGPMFLGGWVDTGSAFDHWDDKDVATHVSVGFIADSLIGPVFAGTGFGFDGAFRFYVGVGRLFR
ncbi:MAG TPA: patatin-like phospholipase family protein [Vicinamibacterales bacterium]|nr:patatin-like phospholipase family protein [Vicinamibacterales bacterium]